MSDGPAFNVGATEHRPIERNFRCPAIRTRSLSSQDRYTRTSAEHSKRVTVDPTCTIGLTDVFGHQTGAASFLQLGFVLVWLSTSQSRAPKSHNASMVRPSPPPSGFSSRPSTQFEQFGLDEAAIHLGPLNVSQELMRDHFDPARTPKDDYGIADLSYAD